MSGLYWPHNATFGSFSHPPCWVFLPSTTTFLLPLLLPSTLLILLPTSNHLQVSRSLRQVSLSLGCQTCRVFLRSRSAECSASDSICIFQHTLVIFFCLIKDVFFGAIVRAPFFGPRTFGLQEEKLGQSCFHLNRKKNYRREEEGVDLDFLTCPCAISRCETISWSLAECLTGKYFDKEVRG